MIVIDHRSVSFLDVSPGFCGVLWVRKGRPILKSMPELRPSVNASSLVVIGPTLVGHPLLLGCWEFIEVDTNHAQLFVMQRKPPLVHDHLSITIGERISDEVAFQDHLERQTVTARSLLSVRARLRNEIAPYLGHDPQPAAGCDARTSQSSDDPNDTAGIAVKKDSVVVNVGSFPIGSLVGADLVDVQGAFALLLD